MTTIEGGMISTDNSELFQLMKLKRSHGMARHLLPENYDRVISKYTDIDPKFLFLTDGYNFRNTELNAVIGLEQLKRLDKNIEIRRRNYEHYMKKVSEYKDYFYVCEFDEFNSSFCFPFICKNKENKIKLNKIFDEYDIECRPIVAGNLLKHPFLSKWKDSVNTPNANLLNDNGIYIGNSQFVTIEMIDKAFEHIKRICQ
jgi:CDP-6-deoxy-D-xylo-4-hexulose-3-dehydrase